MTLRNLEIFAAVAECGNMTKAAEKLFISQPSVSLTIAEIEREYDISLFERISGRLHLTQTGEALMGYARKMMEMEQEMEQFLTHESLSYCIRVGATITVGSALISSIIAEMKTTMPNVNYHVTVASTHVIEEMLVKGEVDIALVEGDIKSRNLEVKNIIYDRLVLICSNQHSFQKRATVHIKDLAGVPLILREEESGTRKQLENAVRQNGIEITVRWSSCSYSAIIDAVEHDLGVSVISEMLVRKRIKTGAFHMCNIVGADLGRSFKLVHHKNKYVTEVLTRFAEICRRSSFLENIFET